MTYNLEEHDTALQYTANNAPAPSTHSLACQVTTLDKATVPFLPTASPFRKGAGFQFRCSFSSRQLWKIQLSIGSPKHHSGSNLRSIAPPYILQVLIPTSTWHANGGCSGSRLRWP